MCKSSILKSKILLYVGSVGIIAISYIFCIWNDVSYGDGNDGIILTETQIDTYNREGILIFDKPLFNGNELSIITKHIEKEIEQRPNSVGPYLPYLAYHFTNSYLLQLASNSKVLDIIEQLLNVSKNIGIRILYTRILSKPANNIINKFDPKEFIVPWHQDSNSFTYLSPLKIVSFWLAIDDVDAENGGIQLFNYSSCIRCKYTNLQTIKNTNYEIIDSELPNNDLVTHIHIKKGYASFHDTYIAHSSPINMAKNRRRCAWIVRYCRGDAIIIPNKLKSFPVRYKLIKVR